MAISARKLIYPVFITLLILGLLVIALFFVQLRNLDELRDLVAQEIRSETQRDVHIGAAQLDFSEGIGLLLGEVTLKGASVQESDFTCQKVLVLLHWLPLLKGNIEIEKLIFEGLMVQVTRNEQGTFNFGELSARDVPEKNTSRPTGTLSDLIQAGLMHSVQVRNSELWLVDHYISSGSKPLVTKVTNFSLSLTKPFMQETLRVHVNGDIPFARRESGRVKLDGKLRVSADWSNLSKVAVDAALQVQDVGTHPFEPYLAKIFEQQPGDHLVSLDTQLTGTMDGHVQLSGTLKHNLRAKVLQHDLSKITLPTNGRLDYHLIFNRDTVKFKQLDYQAGDYWVKVRGTYARFLSDTARLTVSLSTSPFLIQNSESYLPLKVFSREIHQRMHSFIKKGEVEVASLNIEGPRAIFEGRSNAEIQKHDSGLIILRHADSGVDELPLQNVTGQLRFKDSAAQVTIEEAQFAHVSIRNVAGTVVNPLTDPGVEASFEAEGALAPLVHLVRKKWSLPGKLAFLKDLEHIQGIGHGKIKVQGPLFHNDQLLWSGIISLDRAGFSKTGWPAPVSNTRGNISFKKSSVFSNTGKKDEKAQTDWTFQFENFSGGFGDHLFQEINGELLVENGVPIKKVRGKIQLGPIEVEQVITVPLEDKIPSFLKNILIKSGTVDFNFKATGPGPGYPQPENSGSLEIKKLFLKHSDGLRPFKDLSAKVAFTDRTIDLETTGGWYGDSPLDIKGRFTRFSKTGPEMVLTIHSNDFLRQDFEGIPFLDTLDYQGPAKVNLKFHSTDQSMNLENRVDLTRASYRYQDFLIKPENISNAIEISAALKPNGRIDFNKVVFELEGSQVSGKGFVRSMDEPYFAIELKSDRFKIWPASQYIRPLQGAMGGDLRFLITAEGDFRKLEETVLDGKVRLEGIEYKPDTFLVPIKISANMKIKNNQFILSKGELESKGSKLFFGGVYSGGESPHLNLQLVGPGLDLNQMISEEGKPSKGFLAWLSGTRVFASGSGEIAIKVNQFAWDFWRIPEIAGTFTFKDQVLQTNDLTIGQPIIDQMTLVGELRLADIRSPSFEVTLNTRNVKTEGLFGIFGDMFQASLTGQTAWLKARLKGRGENLKEITKSLNGRLSLNLKEGRINTGRLLNGVVDLFGIPVDPATVAKRAGQPNTGYLQIFGDFSVADGIAQTENFLYEEKGQRLSLVGAFNLNSSHMATVVGVAPFRRVGRVIEKIPVLGPIVTGGKEGSLITSYYKVEGPFSGPKIESVPFKSISKKVLGTLEGIITAPGDLFKEREPAKP